MALGHPRVRPARGKTSVPSAADHLHAPAPSALRLPYRDALRQPRNAALALRVALLLTVAARALSRGQLVDVLPWIVALATLAALARRLDPERHPLLAPLLESATCCVGVLATGGASSPVIAYLPAPAFAAGLAAGVRALTLVAGLDSAILLVGRLYGGEGLGSWPEYAVMSEQWVCLALALGLLGVWSRSQPSTLEEADPRYAEAHLLLDRLRSVTRSLPGSLDPRSSADHLLDRCSTLAPAASRGAVLLVTDEPAQLVPLAVRGARRVPWRSPLSEPGPLRTAHLQRRAVLDVRERDLEGRRKGSALLAVPMLLGERSIGLVVLESRDRDAFEGRLAELERAVMEDTLHIDTGLLFEEVRSWASLQERERLAQDMHDGVAQDLAYVGFELDALRSQLQRQAPALVDDVTRLRKQLTEMVSDLRLSITDLRSSTGQGRGLGAALTSYARSVATARSMAVHLTLDESAFRLPGESEMALFKVAQETIGSARRDRTVENLWISLSVDPPSGLLRIEHDGHVDPDQPCRGLDLKLIREHVDRLGGDLVLSPRDRGGLVLEVVLEGDRA
jgi:signal transduction histidine kinase